MQPIAPLTCLKQNIVKNKKIFYEKYTGKFYIFDTYGFEEILDKSLINRLKNEVLPN